MDEVKRERLESDWAEKHKIRTIAPFLSIVLGMVINVFVIKSWVMILPFIFTTCCVYYWNLRDVNKYIEIHHDSPDKTIG